MIFITLGSQKFQFNRLLIAVDQLVEDGTITEEVFAQTGYSDYVPKHYSYKQFLDRDEFADVTAKSDIVITHGGTGAIVGALKKGKRVIAVPRRADCGEHVDDHQFQLVGQFKELNLICECDDTDRLADAYETVRTTDYNSYQSNTTTIINSIEAFIEEKEAHTGSKVLMLGNDPSVKGGITSVISQLLDHDWAADGVQMNFIPTYIETNNAKKILFFAKAYKKIKHELKTNRPDIVHMHMSYRGSFTRAYTIHKLCRKYGVPDIIHLHGSEFKKWFDASDENKKKEIRTLLKECKAVVVLGEKWNAAINEMEPSANTVVVSNTVHIPQATVSWKEPLQVLFLGVLIKRKGVADLIQGVHLLKEQGKTDNLRFVIAGSGAEEENLKKQAAELGVKDLVEFAGWTEGEKKTNLLRSSQMLVLPSYNEGLPVAVLEAISYGMPVVSTDVGDISSAVQDGQNGYLVPAGDSKALADAIYSIASDRKKYERFSCRSKELAENSFSDKKYFEVISALYKEFGE